MAWLEWRQKNKPSKPSVLNPISRPPQAFANLLLNTNTTAHGGQQQQQQPPPPQQQQQPQQQYIRATHSAPNTPAKLTGLTAVIRAQQPGMPANSSPVTTSIASAAVARSPQVIQQQPKVHIQAGQQQQSIVLPVRTTPLTTQGSVTAAVTSVSFPVANQQLTTPALPNHPATGAIQTVKIGGGQAQVLF